ncbi:MAG: hypothetical protein ACOH2B_07740 [Burkholderiaceae bacterium]
MRCAPRRAFTDMDADIYVLADADETYPAERVFDLMEPVLCGGRPHDCGRPPYARRLCSRKQAPAAIRSVGRPPIAVGYSSGGANVRAQSCPSCRASSASSWSAMHSELKSPRICSKAYRPNKSPLHWRA